MNCPKCGANKFLFHVGIDDVFETNDLVLPKIPFKAISNETTEECYAFLKCKECYFTTDVDTEVNFSVTIFDVYE